MSTETTKSITAVADIATEAAFESVTKRLASGADFEMITHARLGFSLEEYLRRYELVLAAMAERGLDALCLRSPENITYMTGYETPGYYKYHCLVMGPGFDPVLILRRFESLNIPEYAWIPSFVPVDDWEHPPPSPPMSCACSGSGRASASGWRSRAGSTPSRSTRP